MVGLLFIMAVPSPAQANQPDIHPDCVTNPRPVLCTAMVNELIEELADFKEAFIVANADEVASFYHPRAIAYTSLTGRFFIGRESILNDAVIPLLANIRTITVGFEDFHFSVMNPLTIVTYGRIPNSGVHKDGTTFADPAGVPQILTWTRSDGSDPKRPFLVMSDQE
jgi:hypothetical protein